MYEEKSICSAQSAVSSKPLEVLEPPLSNKGSHDGKGSQRFVFRAVHGPHLFINAKYGSELITQ